MTDARVDSSSGWDGGGRTSVAYQQLWRNVASVACCFTTSDASKVRTLTLTASHHTTVAHNTAEHRQ